MNSKRRQTEFSKRKRSNTFNLQENSMHESMPTLVQVETERNSVSVSVTAPKLAIF